jgi:hypothetical protein
MKLFLIVFSITAFMVSCTSNDGTSSISKEDSIRHAKMLDATSDTANYTSILWLDSMEQDLGTVTEGAQVEVSWRFRNTGKKPLIISQASASCGCTVAEKPDQPVAPGEESKIKAKFNSTGREGTQNKEVLVMANTSPNDHKLSFKIEVQKK